MAVIISKGKMVGFMEHHTRLLTVQKLERLIVNFSDGNFSKEEVFQDKRHGLFYLTKPPGYRKIEKVVATGPNRNLLAQSSLPVHTAAPAGDVMMTDPIGLIRAVKNQTRGV